MIVLNRWLGANLRQLRAALTPMRQRGLTLANALLLQLPAAVALRAWRVVARRVNVRLLNGRRNVASFMAFQDRLPASDLPRLMVIVMPHTLHFLLPCLALLHGRAQVVLLANGAKAWERRLLGQRLPGLPMFVLPVVPASSVPHGELLSLLLTHHRGDFGIVDHDTYVFDPALLRRLPPAEGECMVGVFAQVSQRTGLQYPLTHLLYFNVQALRPLMQRWRIDAREYRNAPPQVAAPFARLGLGPSSYLKDYHAFFDTLHVLLAVALAEGLTLRFEAPNEDAPVMHVGGTSIGSHHTKNLFALYIHLRFLELLDDPLVSARYAFLARPLRHSSAALQRGDTDDPAWRTLPDVQSMMQRLQVAAAARALATATDPG